MTNSPQTTLPSSSSQPFGFGYALMSPRPRSFTRALLHASGEQFAKRFQHDLPCPVLARKIIRYACRANHLYESARLTRQEGRLAIVTNARWDAVDAAAFGVQGSCRAGLPVSDMPACRRTALTRTAKPRGPGIRC
jgi:hypothetical protein